MFLKLDHQRLDVYRVVRLLVVECYRLTRSFPIEERFALTQQIRRAAISVQLNVAEGCSRKSPNERKRFFEISRGSIIEIDAALDISGDLGYFFKEKNPELENYLVRCFTMLSKLIERCRI
jgi:four helix bundle protein